MSKHHNSSCCTTQDVYEVVSENSNLAVTIDEALISCRKDYLIGCGDAGQEAWITTTIKTAMKIFEDISRRTLMKKTFRTYRDCWYNCFELRKSPLVSVESVKYFDEDSVEQTLATTDYYIEKDPFYSLLRFDEDYSYPALRANRPQQISVDFIAGYAQYETDTPEDIKQAINMMVCFLDANRGDCGCTGSVNIARASGAYNTIMSYRVEELTL